MDLIYGIAYKEFGNTSLGIVLKDVGGETEFLRSKTKSTYVGRYWC